MGSTPSSRRERTDTKTLVRLGTERGSDPAVLTAEQRTLVAEIARGDAGEDRVQLWFQGLPEPVRARLRVQGGRIQLEASLAFLEVDSKVGVTRAQGDATRIEGRIARVSLVTSADQPVPRLCVDLALPGETAISTSEQTVEQSGHVVVRQRRDIADAISTPPISIGPPRARGRSLLPWTLAFALGAAGGAIGSWGWLAPWLQHPFALLRPAQAGGGGKAAATRDESASAAPVEAAVAPSAAALAVLLAFPEDADQDIPKFDLPEPPALVTPVNPVAEPFVLEREPQAADESAQVADDDQLGPDLELSEPVPVADLAQGLEIKASEGQTEIVIPMRGSGEGLTRYELTTPGIALTLPHARALVPLENYAAHRPLVRRVWLRHHPTGVQVRIIYPHGSVRDETRFDERGLHVLLRP
jgi:hypothetical protein